MTVSLFVIREGISYYSSANFKKHSGLLHCEHRLDLRAVQILISRNTVIGIRIKGVGCVRAKYVNWTGCVSEIEHRINKSGLKMPSHW